VRASLVVGLALGWLAATRPASAVACLLACGFALRRMPRASEIALGLVGALPGLVLLACHQHAATGAWGISSQSLYYAASDGPPGCFRYGFGRDIGCIHEHGEFVEKNLRDGYDAWAAIKTTARRLKMHGVDATNAEPLAVLTVGALAWCARRPATRVLAAFPVALVLVYAPFYFDGNYPGGGARFLADGLPLELVALAVVVPPAATALAAKLGRAVTARRLAAGLVGLSLVGFALRGHVDHERLRDREGGRPMFEPARLRAAHVERGLVFVDTDHGFSIGFDPDARADRGGLEIARLHGDATDRLLYEARGEPPTWLYDYDVETGGAILAPFAPRESDRIEGESLWPALEQSGAAALPGYPQESCEPGTRTLRVVGFGSARASVRLALPSLHASRVRVLAGGVASPDLTLRIVGDAGELPKTTVAVGACTETAWLDLPENGAGLALEIEGAPAPDGRMLTLDRIVLFHGKESR
jgi:hypothetical protein